MEPSLLVFYFVVAVLVLLLAFMFFFYDRQDGFDEAWNPESKQLLSQLTETKPPAAVIKKPVKAKKAPKEEKKDPEPKAAVSHGKTSQPTQTQVELKWEMKNRSLELKMQKMGETMQKMYATQHEIEISLDTVKAEKNELSERLAKATDELGRTKRVLAKTKDELTEAKSSLKTLSSRMEMKEKERRELSEAGQKMSDDFQIKMEQDAKRHEVLKRKILGLENAITENDRIIEQQIGNMDKTRATHAEEKKLWEEEQAKMLEEVDQTRQILKVIETEIGRFEEAKELMQQYKENIVAENQELTERCEILETKNSELVEECEELAETKKSLLKKVEELGEKPICGGGDKLTAE